MNINDKGKGLYFKYGITKTNGDPVDPDALYFVLRLDSGGDDPIHIEACRRAALVYAHAIKDPSSAIVGRLKQINK
jgi:hypothetical protein